jgi:hypothetical protein
VRRRRRRRRWWWWCRRRNERRRNGRRGEVACAEVSHLFRVRRALAARYGWDPWSVK